MQEILASVFIIFLVVLYASLAMAFLVVAIRNWVWRPIARKFAPQHPEKSYHHIKSPSHEHSPS